MKLIRNAKSAMREAKGLYGTLVSFTTGVETVQKEVGKKLPCKIVFGMYLIENKEVILLCRLDW